MKNLLLIILCVIFHFPGAYSQLQLPRLFSDHMVLQRDQPVRFYGKADAGQQVAVEVEGFIVQTRADESGHWEMLYPAHAAAGPLRITFTSDMESAGKVLKDVWFGDVWVAGGQSNMEWKLAWNVNNFEEEISSADYPGIRFFTVPKEMAIHPQEDIHGGDWVPASPETAGEFSAVAWFFAKKNHLEKNVAVGIISSNWGGTPAEAWTSAERLKEVPGYEKAGMEMLNPAIDWQQRMEENEARNVKKWELINDKESYLKTGAQNTNFKDTEWQEVELPNTDPMKDFVWVRKEVNLPSGGPAKLFLGDINQIGQVFFNGRMVGEESWQDTTSILDLSADLVKKGKNVVAVRAVNSWDNKVYIGKAGKMWIETQKERISLEGFWKYSDNVEPKMPEVEFFNWRPGVLYNQMIAPISGYGIRGAIWYQGENNADKPQYYNELFEAMIEDWRIHWRQGNFPFLFVQLANFMQRKDQPGDSQWAELREAQTLTLSLPATGMATIIDIGVAEDIHPKNKQDVGKRLWLSARKVAYGEENVVFTGPVYESHEINGDQVTVTFNTHGSTLVKKGDKLMGFAIAGEDGDFEWATGKIDGNQVILTSPDVKQPVAIRYGWGDNPAVNLYNEEGLPAVPFRTDR